jgi:hypothetical protein
MQVPEIESAAIVMLGSFNPAIFQPQWLGVRKLIRAEEAENAKITVIQSELADFSTEWFQLQVLQGRFMVTCTDPRQHAPLRDLAGGIFTLLPHTPVTRVGLNRSFHFGTPSTESWHRIGHRLAPKEPWESLMEMPGLRSMLIQGRQKELSDGVLHIKVEPSVKIDRGLFVEVNEEFQSAAKGEAEGAYWVPDLLTARWDAILNFAEVAANHLLELGNE